MTRVTAIRDFYDIRARKARKAGEAFDVTPERLAELNACGTEQGGAPLVREAVREQKRKQAGEGPVE